MEKDKSAGPGDHWTRANKVFPYKGFQESPVGLKMFIDLRQGDKVG